MLFGEVGIYQDEDLQKLVCKKTENHHFGEEALKFEPSIRSESAIAHKVTVCLVLSNTDYNEQVYYVEHKKKLKRLEYIQTLDIFKSWNRERASDFNLILEQRNFNVGEKIYEAGDRPDYIYILTSGWLSMKTILSWTDENKYPTGINRWEILSNVKEVEYEIHRIKPGEIFGH